MITRLHFLLSVLLAIAVIPVRADCSDAQQGVADLFFQIHLTPEAVKVADLVWKKAN